MLQKREDGFQIRTSDGKFFDDHSVARAHQDMLDRWKEMEEGSSTPTPARQATEEEKLARLYFIPFFIPWIYMFGLIDRLGGGWYWLLIITPIFPFMGVLYLVYNLKKTKRLVFDCVIVAAFLAELWYVYTTVLS